MATTYEIFALAERIEQRSADGYGHLARQFLSDPEAAATFNRLQAEEIQHATRVRLLAARYRHDPRLLGTPDLAARELAAILEEVEAAVEAMRDGSFGRGLEEVLTNLVALEERVAHAHAELISRTGHPEVRAFFEVLAAQDAEHARLLRPGEPRPERASHLHRPRETARQADRSRRRRR